MEAGRRKFIKKALYAVLSIIGLGILAPGLEILTPVAGRPKELAWFPLMSEDDVPRKGVRKCELTYAVAGKERKARVFIISSAEGLKVLSATCSHLGCLVNYNREKEQFICPCHGGRYDQNGKNISGPPPAPLSALPVKTGGGVVLVGMRV